MTSTDPQTSDTHPASRFLPDPDQVAPRTIVARSDPTFRCGHCHAEIREHCGGLYVRCPACNQRSTLPPFVWVACQRCGFEHRYQTDQLRAERFCAGCSLPLHIDEVILQPLYRRRRASRCSDTGRRDQAVGYLLLFGLGLALLAILLQRLN